MFGNFKRPILLSYLVASVAIGVVGGALAVGAAEAAPDFGPYNSLSKKHFDAGQDLTAIRARTEISALQTLNDLAGGHFGNAVVPTTLAMQSVGEFTNVFPPVKALAMAKFKEGGPQSASVTPPKVGVEDVSEFTAAYQTPVQTQMRSALADVSSETNHIQNVGRLDPLTMELVAYQVSPAIKVQHVKMTAKSCEALAAKLDHQHLKPSVEKVRLAKQGCAKFDKSI